MLLEQIAKLDTDQTEGYAGWARRVDQDGREPKSWDDNELDLHDHLSRWLRPG